MNSNPTPAEKDAMALAVIEREANEISLCGGAMFANELREARAHLAARVAELSAENDRAWTAANRADAKVRGWEATMVCTGLPFRVCPVDAWGPGADGTVEVPQLTTEKLTSILDRLTRAEAELAAVRANAERYVWLRERATDELAIRFRAPNITHPHLWAYYMSTGIQADAAVDAARGAG